MWMTVLIAGGLFVAMLAMLWLNLDDAERRRAEEEAAATAARAGAAAGQGQCLLCEAPLPERRTSDEVVLDLERRIATDLAEIEAVLGGGRERPRALEAGRGRA